MKPILGAAIAMMISVPAVAQVAPQTTPSEATHGEPPVQAGAQATEGRDGVKATSAAEAAAKSGHGQASVPKNCHGTDGTTKSCS
jgi:hypothetical protein